MKKLTAALTILLAATAAYGAEKAFTPATWASARKNYDIFLQKPSSGHAKKLMKSLPATVAGLTAEDRARDETAEYLFEEDRFGHFKNILKSKKTAYLKLLFRMLNIAGEERAALVEEQIGLYIPAMPEEFLKGAADFTDYQLRGILGKFAEEYDFDNNKRLEELKLNLAAIEKVRGKKYSKIKQRCVDILRIFIEERESRKE